MKLRSYPAALIVLKNFLVLLQVGIGFLGMFSVKFGKFPWLSVSYLGFAVFTVGFLLRKHLCTNCFYYDGWCSTGWGKLSAFLFAKNSGNFTFGVNLARVTWTILGTVPVVVMGTLLVLRYSLKELVYLVGFIVVVITNFLLHRKTCESCVERDRCLIRV